MAEKDATQWLEQKVEDALTRAATLEQKRRSVADEWRELRDAKLSTNAQVADPGDILKLVDAPASVHDVRSSVLRFVDTPVHQQDIRFMPSDCAIFAAELSDELVKAHAACKFSNLRFAQVARDRAHWVVEGVVVALNLTRGAQRLQSASPVRCLRKLSSLSVCGVIACLQHEMCGRSALCSRSRPRSAFASLRAIAPAEDHVLGLIVEGVIAFGAVGRALRGTAGVCRASL